MFSAEQTDPMRKLGVALLLLILHANTRPGQADEFELKAVAIRPKSRIDAIAHFGSGVVIAGTRMPHPGDIHKSEDYGVSWRRVGNITGDDFITCIASSEDGTGYLLTGNHVHVWKSNDRGESWKDLGQISDASNPVFANAYGMVVTENGTLLVADADRKGGHVHRSTDGGVTWIDLGAVSTHALYRLIEVGDGILANGWAGHIYKSSDDGKTWRDMGKLIGSDLYAIESIGNDTVLIGTKSGNIFVSHDNGVTWKDRGVVGAAADDFSWLGGRRVLYSTYNGNRHLYFSEDAGETWASLGRVPTTDPNDWLDHVIYINDGRMRTVVGGTNNGFIVHARLPGE